MTFKFEERLILNSFELLSPKEDLRRDEIVLFSYGQLIELENSGSYRVKYENFEKLINNRSVDLKLIQKINNIINEMIEEKKLEYSNKKAIDSIEHSRLTIHILSHGDKELIRRTDLTNQTLAKEISLNREEKVRASLDNSPLTPSLNVANYFAWREIIPCYRDYSIARSRWSDREGTTNVEVQYFNYYVVLIEYGHYTNVAVVDREYYQENPFPDQFLLDPSSGYQNYRDRTSIETWEPLDGLLQDSLICYLRDLETFRQGKEFLGKRKGNLNFKDIDLIHSSAHTFLFQLFKKEIWDIHFPEDNLQMPWWMLDAQMRRDESKISEYRFKDEESGATLDDGWDRMPDFSGAISAEMMNEIDDCYSPLVDDGQYD